MDTMHTPFPFGWHIPFFLNFYRIKIKCTIIFERNIHNKYSILYYKIIFICAPKHNAPKIGIKVQNIIYSHNFCPLKI